MLIDRVFILKWRDPGINDKRDKIKLLQAYECKENTRIFFSNKIAFII